MSGGAIPEGFVPDPADEALLALAPADVERQMEREVQPELLAACVLTLPHSAREKCRRVYEVTARVAPKFIGTRQQLLRGEIGDEEFHTRWQQLFLERQIGLEQFLSYDEQVALE